MSEENAHLVEEAYAAHRRRDLAAVFAFLHPEIEILQTELLPWGGRHRGHEGARAFFQRLAEHVDALPEPEIYVPAGDDVAVYGRLKGRARASGAEINLPIVHLWTIQHGRATRFAAFIDTPAMLKSMAGK